MKRLSLLLASLLLIISCTFPLSCAEQKTEDYTDAIVDASDAVSVDGKGEIVEEEPQYIEHAPAVEGYNEKEKPLSSIPSEVEEYSGFDLSSVPEFNGSPFVEINGNKPFFTENDIKDISFEIYAPLDFLGRCGIAFANIGIDIMPTEERESIGTVKPAGWQTVKYDFVDGKYLYNRCHLIGFQLSGENANEKNLITGTRYMNVQGMLPFENEVATYVERTGKHVLYRVTPVYVGDELLARGVLMEAYSVEDGGKGICFNVFCYNAQPGVMIDYATGNSYEVSEPETEEFIKYSYVGNKNSGKLHYDYCSSVKSMKESNKEYLECTRDEAINMGYSPCGICKP